MNIIFGRRDKLGGGLVLGGEQLCRLERDTSDGGEGSNQRWEGSLDIARPLAKDTCCDGRGLGRESAARELGRHVRDDRRRRGERGGVDDVVIVAQARHEDGGRQRLVLNTVDVFKRPGGHDALQYVHELHACLLEESVRPCALRLETTVYDGGTPIVRRLALDEHH